MISIELLKLKKIIYFPHPPPPLSIQLLAMLFYFAIFFKHVKNWNISKLLYRIITKGLN